MSPDRAVLDSNLKDLATATGSKADAARIEEEMQAGFGQVNQKLDAVLERLPKPDEEISAVGTSMKSVTDACGR